MSLKEFIEAAAVVVSLALVVLGALYNFATGTTTTRRAYLSGQVMEQAIKALQERVDTLEREMQELKKDLDHGRKVITALEALARSLGASARQLANAMLGLFEEP